MEPQRRSTDVATPCMGAGTLPRWLAPGPLARTRMAGASVSPGVLLGGCGGAPVLAACCAASPGTPASAPASERLLRCTAKLAAMGNVPGCLCMLLSGDGTAAPVGGMDGSCGSAKLWRTYVAGRPGDGVSAAAEGERAGLDRCCRTRRDSADNFACCARSCAACWRIVLCSCVLCSMSCAVVGLRGAAGRASSSPSASGDLHEHHIQLSSGTWPQQRPLHQPVRTMISPRDPP